ncbi:hypothetical protein BDV26DRAFT_252108 [Aspergillus bertholletiae]|uniref:Uncharacterized protein n=1 Tax=Aspergillus bertholletiae TaxID=1226010 RepID=A0A5N7BMK5_9EURO|nr:hypothetical protein BDV26DRAFT_252108 [Aspergillus bertholletiae]
MVELISPPDPRTLLPPLLACLPTAFASPLPPPALLPLLSPVLRQRVQVLSSLAASSSDSWLRLLCWDVGKAERLQTVVGESSFEPHPVSGEIELPDEAPVEYKRVDEETLQSRVLLPDYRLKVIYLWCPNDKDGGGPGWRVAELLPHENSRADSDFWSASIGEANSHSKEQLMEDALRAAEKEEAAKDDDDDDDYWAQYDATPGRTPSVKTPAPNARSTIQHQGMSEASYFSQYADVQPAMDNHDPSEEQPELGPSSLGGDLLTNLLKSHADNQASESRLHLNGHEDTDMALSHPRPSSASSNSSEAVAKLELEAENQSACEVGVKQHIGSNIKSLFRLARATGITRAEFQSLVRTELELLNVSDDD